MNTIIASKKKAKQLEEKKEKKPNYTSINKKSKDPILISLSKDNNNNDNNNKNISIETLNSNDKCNKCSKYEREIESLVYYKSEVEKKYGFSASNIRACIRGKNKSAGKHPITKEPLHWKECPELINTKNKLTEKKVKELIG